MCVVVVTGVIVVVDDLIDEIIVRVVHGHSGRRRGVGGEGGIAIIMYACVLCSTQWYTDRRDVCDRFVDDDECWRHGEYGW